MPEQVPVVYLLHGEDDYAISEYIARLIEKLGDPMMAEVNTSRLDGRLCSLDELVGAVSAMPFLVSRRMVILFQPLAYGKPPELRKRFLELLNTVPSTTALVLAENHQLTSWDEQKHDRINWLEKWAEESKGRALLRYFGIPTGSELVGRILKQTKTAGGQIKLHAAEKLAELVGPEPRLIEAEIEKLLAYVNYKREIDVDDVLFLTPDVTGAPDFAMVNAIRQHNIRDALSFLRKELLEDEPLVILHRIVYQFRLLIMAREILDEGGSQADVIRIIIELPFKPQRIKETPARIAAQTAQNFKISELDSIYHRLLDADEAMKTSAMEGELALDLLVTELSS
jgi:DNA polymerase III subunit delta